MKTQDETQEKKMAAAPGTMEEDTIAAIATAVGKAGIGIVRISGSDAFSIVQAVFRPTGTPLSRTDDRKLRYGHIVCGKKIIDEVLVSFMRGPHTYTAEDVVEINAHGGALSVRRILALVLEKGARFAERGEFTRRAFLNGRIDLAQAEAVRDVIDAQTTRAHEQAVKQLDGKLSKEINRIKDSVLQLLAEMEYGINFMEDAQEELPQEPMQNAARAILASMDALLSSAARGRLLREGIATAIVGSPNVGKSSLLNALLCESRAIVTDIPGTTRDSIEESYDLDGILLRLIDTAGIRETEDRVEAIGVERSRALMREADLILLVLDTARVPQKQDDELVAEAAAGTALLLLNKSDQPTADAFAQKLAQWKTQYPALSWLEISAKTGAGLSRLEEAIRDLFFEGAVENAPPAALTNLRQAELVRKSRNEVQQTLEDLERGVVLDAVEVSLRSAYRYLCEVTGESMDEKVLDRIFQSFCVGK